MNTSTTTNATPDLHCYDMVLLNSSGGKDSQTMLEKMVQLADATSYPRARLVVAHADLGRVEWKGTKELAQKQAEHYGLRFEVIARPQGDLLSHVASRGKWPGPQQRYCTSDHKRGQIQKIITKLHREHTVNTGNKYFSLLNCMGLRREESVARSKKPAYQFSTIGTTQKRQVDQWFPIHDMLETEVWDTIRASDVPYHPAYDLGMPRLSCCFCIFAPRSALVLAGYHNRELLEQYVLTEIDIGHTFRQDLSLYEVWESVEAGENVPSEGMSGTWNM